MAKTLILKDSNNKDITFYTNTKGSSPGYQVQIQYDSVTRSGTTVTMNNAKLVLVETVGTYGTVNRIACKVGVGGSKNNVKDNATIHSAQADYSSSTESIDLGNLSISNHTSTTFEIYVAVASTGWNTGWTNFQGGSPVEGTLYAEAPAAYPTFTTQPSATNEEETSVTLNPGVTNMKSKFYYKLSSSSTWIEFSGSVQITGLSPGTAYTINVQARNEADTSLATNATNVSVTTKKYPYILSITTGTSTSSRSNAGEQQTVKIYNPLKRDIILYMDHNSKGGTNIYTSASLNGEEHSFTIPLDKAGKALGATGKTGNAIYHVKYGSQASATITGYYQITEAYAKPTWSASLNVNNLIKYKDGNATSAGVTGSTDSAPILLQKYSTLYVGLNSSSYGATAQYSAAISKYQISINSGSYVDYTGSASATTGVQNMSHTVAANAVSVSVKVRAIDGRGFISEAKELVIPVRTYASPTGAARFERNGGYGIAATVTVSPTWGYPKPSGAEKATVITRQKGTTTTIETLSFTSLKTSASKAATKTYNNNLVYECVATFTDAFGTASSAVIGTMIEGQPIFFIDSALQGVGVNCFPDEKGLKVEGTIKGRNGYRVDHGLRFGRQDFTVGGDAATYYPVLLRSSGFAYGAYHIYRGYNETAPDTWNTATHRGGLTFSFFWSGDTGWGGNDHNIKVLELDETYCKMVTRMHLCPNGLLVWLRGGGASYHIESDMGTAVLVSVHLDGYTDSAKVNYTSMAYDATTAQNSILTKEISHPYPVGSIYISIKETSPASIYGGSWTKIKDKFLYATSATGDAGKNGGSATSSYKPEGTIAGTIGGTAISVDQMPSHAHHQSQTGQDKKINEMSTSEASGSYWPDRSGGWGAGVRSYHQDAWGDGWLVTTGYRGGGQTHTHTFSGTFTGTEKSISINPAHYTVHAWVRTA